MLDTLALRGPLAPYIVMHSVDGLEAPAYRVSQYDNPGKSGGTVSSEFYGSRMVTIEAELIAPDVTTYAAMRQALAYACRIQKDSNGFPVSTTLSFQTLDGTNYFSHCYVKSLTHPLGLPTTSTFMISLVITDPALYISGQVTTGQFSGPVSGGVIYPVTYPAIYGGTTGGTGTLTNAGNANTPPVFTLRGVWTNPYIYAIERGKGFKLNYTTSPGDIVVIDMKAQTITLNGVTSLLAYKDDTASWFGLVPGVNTFQISSSSTSDSGTLEVTAFSAVLGV